jgi:hypothetical protein
VTLPLHIQLRGPAASGPTDAEPVALLVAEHAVVLVGQFEGVADDLLKGEAVLKISRDREAQLGVCVLAYTHLHVHAAVWFWLGGSPLAIRVGLMVHKVSVSMFVCLDQ